MCCIVSLLKAKACVLLGIEWNVFWSISIVKTLKHTPSKKNQRERWEVLISYAYMVPHVRPSHWKVLAAHSFGAGLRLVFRKRDA